MEKFRLLSKRDALQLLEIIYESLSCYDERALRHVADKLKTLFHFDLAVFGLAPIDNRCQTKNHYNLININCPRQLLEYYLSKELFKVDPIVNENCKSFRVHYWKDVYNKHKTDKEFVSYIESLGIRSGYTHGIRDLPNKKGSLFSFAGQSIERHPRTELILEHVVPHFHQSLLRISSGLNKKNIQLSDRETEVLKWIKEGKSTWEISRILSVSENTVKFHIKNIFQKLDVVNRAQAVAVALEHGIIEFD